MKKIYWNEFYNDCVKMTDRSFLHYPIIIYASPILFVAMILVIMERIFKKLKTIGVLKA